MTDLPLMITGIGVTTSVVAAAGFTAHRYDWSLPGILVLMAATGSILAALFAGL